MAVWEDVVSTGLIGTDRRPVPDKLPPSWSRELDHDLDPAHTVLGLAARHRAVHRAGRQLASCPPNEAPPSNGEPIAGRAAHEILVRLLFPPQIDLLNLWLIAANEHGQRVSAAYWTSLVMLAVRTSELDRPALARVLGERGMWFVAQNPQWTRVAKALSDAEQERPPEPDGVEISAAGQAVRADPELILRVPPPWPHQLSRIVLEIITSGQLQQRGPRFAAAVGARLPLQHYALLQSTIPRIATHDLPPAPADVRSLREAVLVLERTVWLRIEMQSAFSGEPITVPRLEIPPW